MVKTIYTRQNKSHCFLFQIQVLETLPATYIAAIVHWTKSSVGDIASYTYCSYGLLDKSQHWNQLSHWLDTRSTQPQVDHWNIASSDSSTSVQKTQKQVHIYGLVFILFCVIIFTKGLQSFCLLFSFLKVYKYVKEYSLDSCI